MAGGAAAAMEAKGKPRALTPIQPRCGGFVCLCFFFWSHKPHLPMKVEALLGALKELRAKDPSSKSVVFSQWTSMLDLLSEPLSNSGFAFLRLDGTVPQAKRDEILTKFKTSDIPLLLVSLRAGGVGLNLTAANNCFLLDLWWNPAGEDNFSHFSAKGKQPKTSKQTKKFMTKIVEEQAIDRVHRIGQTRPVFGDAVRDQGHCGAQDAGTAITQAADRLHGLVTQQGPAGPGAPGRAGLPLHRLRDLNWLQSFLSTFSVVHFFISFLSLSHAHNKFHSLSGGSFRSCLFVHRKKSMNWMVEPELILARP